MSNALGIDLGTTKVAAVIVDDAGKPLDAVSILLPDRSVDETILERDPADVFKAVDMAVGGLNAGARQSVDAIGICGQMHGVLLWNDLSEDHGPFVTWEDKRADQGTFLNDMRLKTGESDIHSGDGSVTLAWLRQNDPDQLAAYTYAGTIMDYLVSCCCDMPAPLMDPTTAASWGLFDVHQRQWDWEAIAEMDVPSQFLPDVKPMGSPAGTLCGAMADRWGLRKEALVTVATGDSPAAVYGCRERIEDGVFLNVGTGSQLSVVVPGEALTGLESEIGIETRPFLTNRFLLTAASVCGGQSFQWLVERVESWCGELGMAPPARDDLCRLLNNLGESCISPELPEFLPYLKKERHHPDTMGSISGIGWSNLSLGALAKSLARGMVESLWNRLPAEILKDRRSLVATGNGIRRWPLLQGAAKEVSGLPIILSELHEEAATGAARLAWEALLAS